jgi:hypothetical protein
MSAPVCCGGRACILVTGAEIWPHSDRLRDKPIWVCEVCHARVGCHPGGTEPLGTPAGPALRRARSILHDRLVDPLWQNAPDHPCYAVEREPRNARERKRMASPEWKAKRRRDIWRAARARVYEFLAERLGLSIDDCHVAMFDLETCRQAWRALEGVTYDEIRAWSIDRRAAAVKAEIAGAE